MDYMQIGVEMTKTGHKHWHATEKKHEKSVIEQSALIREKIHLHVVSLWDATARGRTLETDFKRHFIPQTCHISKRLSETDLSFCPSESLLRLQNNHRHQSEEYALSRWSLAQTIIKVESPLKLLAVRSIFGFNSLMRMRSH